jgi:glycosyltransferase involved in cell wall biosynthesis
MRHARGEIVVVMAADNGLPRPDWLRLMVRPFIERPDVIGAFTRIVPAPEDNAFTRYYCRLHVEPFTWFVYGAAANPARFGHAYGVAHEGEGYVLYRFTLRRHPLVALAQGFAVRRRFTRRPGFEHDDILPILQMIEDGQAIAYVPEAGIYHHHLNGLAHFARKYRWRIRNSLYGRPLGFDVRYRYLSRWRRARRYLFELYGLSAILPLLDGCALALRERDPCMLWHGPATIVLSWVILIEYARKWAGRGAGP